MRHKSSQEVDAGKRAEPCSRLVFLCSWGPLSGEGGDGKEGSLDLPGKQDSGPDSTAPEGSLLPQRSGGEAVPWERGTRTPCYPRGPRITSILRRWGLRESESPVELFKVDIPVHSSDMTHCSWWKRRGESNPSPSVSEWLQTIQAL